MILNQLLPDSERDAFQTALTCFSDRCIRLHANRSEPILPFSVSDVPWYGFGRFLADSSLRPASFLNYATADYYIQDAASLLPLALLAPQASDRICDLCASPGGKASAIAERLGPDGFLLANESIRSRVDVLRYSLARTGNPCFAVSSYDPDDLASQLHQSFDAVLVDAPCSGQTLVARNKRDENAFAENQIEHCALRQQRILQSAIRLLKPGGRLIYSTCTFAMEENESQIRWLRERYPNAWEPIEVIGLEAWRSPVEAGCYRLWPHRDRCAGGFAAGLRLVREIDFEQLAINQRTGKKVREGATEKSTHRTEKEKQRRVQDALSALGTFGDVSSVWKSGFGQCATRGATTAISDFKHIAMDPLAILIETGSHFVPTQGLAMLAQSHFNPANTIELKSGQAKQFTAGSSISITSDDTPSLARGSGWSVATWDSKPLGWCKALSNRLNNHLPPWARLQLD